MEKHWPYLSYKTSKDTYFTIHMWLQIIGKVKLCLLPWVNHSWHVTLTVTPQGFTSGDIPANSKDFQINLDLLKHQLQFITSDNEEKVLDLKTLSVAGFYEEVIASLKSFGIDCKINPVPNEMENVLPFHENHSSVYVPEQAQDLHNAFLRANDVLSEFRAKFIGKCSPLHLFWGSFDLAVSRFSGRKAPLHPGGVPNLPDRVAQEAYSHEVISSGFWPGNEAAPFPAFYSYIYPEPEGYKNYAVKPEAAYYDENLREFLLPYEEVRKSGDPRATLMEFLQSTYEAGAVLAKWDREKLEKQDANY